MHSHQPVAAQHDRPQVAGVELVDPDQFNEGVGQLVRRERDLDAVIFAESSSRRICSRRRKIAGPDLRFVAPNAFKNRAPVTDDVGEYVNSGVVPSNELAVVPDLLCRV